MIAVSAKKAVGPVHNLDAMRHAQRMTWRAVELIAKQIKPSLHESAAQVITGNDPQIRACAEAAKTQFDKVEARWKVQGVSSAELYGYRISDFPHAIHRGGDLGKFEGSPNAALWILEIQLAHPTLGYRAFYEDPLV